MVANNGLQAVETEGLPLAFVESDPSVRREVEEVKEAVHGVIEEAPLPDKVESLQVLIAEISAEVES